MLRRRALAPALVVVMTTTIACDGCDPRVWLRVLGDMDRVIVVYTANTIGDHPTLPQYSLRLRGIAEVFHDDIAYQGGLIGLQETRAELRDCWAHSAPAGAGPFKAGECMAFLLRDYFPEEASRIHSMDHAPLAIAVGPNWTQESGRFDELVSDGFNEDMRFLVESLVRHHREDWSLRFYTTHLSHGDRLGRRLEQVQKLRKIIKERVTPGELLPIIAGDFNFLPEGEAASNDLALDFEKLADNDSVDQVWVGRASAFPGCRHSIALIERRILPLNEEQAVEFEFNGMTPAYHGQLSDHAGLRVTLEVVE